MKQTSNTTNAVAFNSSLRSICLIVALLVVALFATAVIILGGVKFTLMLGGGVVGLALFFMPPQWLLCLLIVYAFMILGPLNSLLGIDTHWIPYLIGLAICFQSLLYQIGSKKEEKKRREKIPKYLWSFLFFSFIAVFSTIFSSPNYYTLLTSVRSLFFFWGIYFIFISCSKFSPVFFRNSCIFFVVSGFLQLPMVIYQRLFVSSSRNDVYFWDSVIGTFPGDKIAGDSGGMAFFLISTAVIATAMWMFGKLKGSHTLLITLLLISPILLAEAKISYVLLPIMIALIFRADIIKNPFKFVTILAGALIVVGGVFMAGKFFNSNETEFNKPFDIEEEYSATFGYSLGSDSYDGDDNMGRMTLLNFWWKMNKNEPYRLALGHGLGSSLLTNTHLKSGKVGWKYRPAHISNTDAARLLWDAGIFGLVAYISIFIFGSMRAAKLSKAVAIPSFHQALLYAASVILISRVILIPYQVTSTTTNVFIFMLLGMVGYWSKHCAVSINKDALINE